MGKVELTIEGYSFSVEYYTEQRQHHIEKVYDQNGTDVTDPWGYTIENVYMPALKMAVEAEQWL